MKKLPFLFATLFTFNSIHSQILTIDLTDTAAYQKKTVFQGNLSIGIEGDKQKTLLLDGTNSLNAQLQYNKELFILASSYRFTYAGKEDFLNSGYVHLRWRSGYKNRLQPETFMQYQWDQSRGMLQRYIAGENARLDFWHKNNWEFSLASGVMYETETWNYTGVDSALKPSIEKDQVTHLLKSNNYAKFEGRTSANSNLSFIVFYQAPFSNFFTQYRVATSLRFAVAFTKHFDFAISFSSLYDSKPVVPILDFYFSFSNAIVYKF